MVSQLSCSDPYCVEEGPPRDTTGGIVLLGAGFSTSNLGVWALASSAIASSVRAFPGVIVTLIDYSHEPKVHSVQLSGSTIDVELVNIRFSKDLCLSNNIARLLVSALVWRLIPFEILRARIIENNRPLSIIARATLIASVAGGDSFSDVYGLGRLLYVSLPQVLTLLMRKRLILLPQTLGPFKTRIARAIARFILRRAEVVCTRDLESVVEIRPLMRGCARSPRISYDMAFSLPAIEPAKAKLVQLRRIQERGRLVGLNVSGLLYMGGYSKNNMFALKSDYQLVVAEIIRYFVRQGVQMLLIPHVLGSGPGSESDLVASEKIHRKLEQESDGQLHCLEGHFDHQEIKYVIGECDFFLGSRMHACIAALSQCVPAVGLAYSRKFAGVFRTIGAGDLVVDLGTVELAETVQRVDAVYRARTEVRNRLRCRVPRIRTDLECLFSDLAHAKGGQRN